MGDFITQLLAKWLDKFKASNPKVFVFVQLALLLVIYGVEKGIELEAFASGPVTDAINLVIPIIMAAIGTRTVRHMEPPEGVSAQSNPDYWD